MSWATGMLSASTNVLSSPMRSTFCTIKIVNAGVTRRTRPLVLNHDRSIGTIEARRHFEDLRTAPMTIPSPSFLLLPTTNASSYDRKHRFTARKLATASHVKRGPTDRSSFFLFTRYVWAPFRVN